MSNTSIQLSIQPTFLCNYNCEFCYLGDLRKDKTVLDLDVLKHRLEEITKNYNINKIQILGGEVSILDSNYLNDLCNIIKDYPYAITTNLSNNWLINYCLQNDINLGVSLNEERPFYKETLNKLRTLKNIKCITLSSIVLPSLLNKSPKEILKFYESLGFTVYFVQYHPSLTNNVVYDLTLDDYNNFMNNLIREYKTNHYNLILGNEIAMNDTTHSASYDDCLLINPTGKLSVIIENDEGYEYYKEFDNIEEYNIFKNEYKTYRTNECLKCEYYNKCLGAHLVSSNANKCSKLFKMMNEKELL